MVAEELSNDNTEGPPLQSVPIAYNDQRYFRDEANKERSTMAFMVKNFGGWELQKELKLRASDRPEASPGEDNFHNSFRHINYDLGIITIVWSNSQFIISV